MKSTVTTTCGICSAGCGMKITFDMERILKIEGQADHPVSRGYLCPKGRAVKELIEAPDRLKSPVKKTSQGQWQEVSWREAIDFVVQNITRIKNSYGPEALAVHVGQAGVGKQFAHYAERFCRAYGTPNFSTAGSHCHISKMMANVITYGVLPIPDYTNSNCIVLWGYNPSSSCPPLMDFINKALLRGARLIVVDPKKTATAKRANLHLQIRPGTGGALALGLLHVIVKENLYDQKFVESWTTGFDRLVDLITEYPPETVEKITWVKAENIREAAVLYAQSPPACIYPGIAVELNTNGFQAARAIAIMQAVTGNLDITGGALFGPSVKLAPLTLKNIKWNNKTAIGQNEYPLFFKHTNNAQANIYSRAILEGKPYPLKGMIVSGSNPLLTWPNAGKLKEALPRLEFLAVVDHFMTDTARLADIVLPAATFLSRGELWDSSPVFGPPRIGLAEKVYREEGCMSDWDFWRELVEKVGYKYILPLLDEESATNCRLKPISLTTEELKQNPHGFVYAERIEKSYETSGFKTPTGKVEIYSEELEKYGYDPLPVYKDPAESPESTPEKAAEYPFVLSTGARNLGYLHSRYRNMPSLRRLNPEPLVEVHKDKAKDMGLKDGDAVLVESPRASIELKVKLTDDIDPRVIYIPHGWSEANVNYLTDSEDLDPVTGFPGDRSLLARIVKMN